MQVGAWGNRCGRVANVLVPASLALQCTSSVLTGPAAVAPGNLGALGDMVSGSGPMRARLSPSVSRGLSCPGPGNLNRHAKSGHDVFREGSNRAAIGEMKAVTGHVCVLHRCSKPLPCKTPDAHQQIADKLSNPVVVAATSLFVLVSLPADAHPRRGLSGVSSALRCCNPWFLGVLSLPRRWTSGGIGWPAGSRGHPEAGRRRLPTTRLSWKLLLRIVCARVECTERADCCSSDVAVLPFMLTSLLRGGHSSLGRSVACSLPRLPRRTSLKICFYPLLGRRISAPFALSCAWKEQHGRRALSQWGYPSSDLYPSVEIHSLDLPHGEPNIPPNNGNGRVVY